MRRLAIALLLVSACNFDGPDGKGGDGDGDGNGAVEESLPELDDAAAAAVRDGVPGVVVSIRAGDRHYSAAAGLADRDADVAMRPDHEFRIASNSKSMIGAVFAELASEGAVDLDGLAAPYLPAEVVGRVANADRCTIRQLLTHTAGVREFADWALWEQAIADPDRGLSTAEALAHIYDLPAEFAPGTSWSYSNSNYLLAGLVLDTLAGGEHHSKLIRERIFDAVPMKSAYYEEHEPAIGELARGYEDYVGGPALDDVTDINVGMGLAPGAVVSSIPDLADYVQALGRDLLDGGAASEMFAAVPDDLGRGYGLGIGVEESPTAYVHGGELPGFVTDMIVFPGDDVSVAVGVTASQDDAADAAGYALFEAAIEIAREL